MDFTKLAEVAPAYVGLIIFVWFTVTINRQTQAESTTRDERWERFLATQAQEYRAAFKVQDEHWATFLGAERDQRKQATEYSMRQMDALVAAVRELTEGISEHEKAAVARHERTMSGLADHDSKVADRVAEVVGQSVAPTRRRR